MENLDSIEIFNESNEVDLDSLVSLKLVILKILSDYGMNLLYENIVLLSDEELLEINREFLDHDFYTDVITFNYADDPKNIEAEIYISLDRVRENATNLGLSFESELNRIIIHGNLHLVGFDDATEIERNNMQAFENQYLAEIVPRGT